MVIQINKSKKIFKLIFVLFFSNLKIYAQIEPKINWSIVAGPEFNSFGFSRNYGFNGVNVGFLGGFSGNYHVNEKNDFVFGVNYSFRPVDMTLSESGALSQKITTHAIEIPLGVRRFLFYNKRYTNFFIGAAYLNNFVFATSAKIKLTDGFISYYSDIDKNISFYNPGFKLECGLKNQSYKRKHVMFSGFLKSNFMNLLSNFKQEKYNYLTIGANIEFVFY